MRELLFRGKRTDNGEWVEGDLFHNLIYDGVSEKETRIGNVYFYGDEIHGTEVYNVIPETVGQYTELTDRNGKKIFEGDIIKYEYHESNDKIEFANGAFGYRCIRFDYFASFDDSEYGITTDDAEIIGNIHDNPELLKQTRGKI